MSYCVNCGVEVHPATRTCPLCHTAVVNPNQAVDTELPPPFPTQRSEVQPVDRRELILLLSAMLASVAVCSGLLNIFLLYSDRPWSLYVIGAAVMFWIWLVPPLFVHAMPLWVRLFLDEAAVGVYVYLISIDLGGQDWFLGLALPIILTNGALVMALSVVLGNKNRSILTSVTVLIGAIGIFLCGVEFFIDRWLFQAWVPGWSIVVLTICVAMMIPLIVVRRRPILREEVRRRFHM